MIKIIFIDTGAFYASKVSNDINHASAKSIEQSIVEGYYGKMITTSYILDELYTLLRCNLTHTETIKIGEAIRNSPNIRVLWISDVIEENTWEYFKKHQDMEYSFTDCTSFVIMGSLGIDLAFTFDSHFEQAGFKCLR